LPPCGGLRDMTTIDSVESFYQALRRSQLVDAAQLNEVKLELLPEAHDPQELSQYLVEMEWLTEYQAEQLLTGHDQELVLEPYEIVEPVGEGGLCQVFKAWDSVDQRIVALKVIHPELREKKEIVEQLRQEMTVLSRLDHPCFIKALERPGTTRVESAGCASLARLAQHNDGDGHARVHRAGAGRQCSPGRHTRRHLQPGLHPLSPADGIGALPGQVAHQETARSPAGSGAFDPELAPGVPAGTGVGTGAGSPLHALPEKLVYRFQFVQNVSWGDLRMFG
jgi:Protein kinase domain